MEPHKKTTEKKKMTTKAEYRAENKLNSRLVEITNLLLAIKNGLLCYESSEIAKLQRERLELIQPHKKKKPRNHNEQ